MRIQFGYSVILTFAFAGASFAQSDLKSVLDPDNSPDTQVGAEDIPPPEPVPASSSNAPRATNSAPKGEIHAYNFGVSMLSTAAGVKVRGVIVGSAAEAAGVKPNDMIVSVNGNAVGDGSSLQSTPVESVSILRDGKTTQLDVPAHDAPHSGVAAQRVPTSSRAPRATYAVPRTVVSTPPSYRIGPSYNYRPRTTYSYRPAQRYYGPDYGYPNYGAYRASPRVSIGIGVGSGGYYRGYPGYGRIGYPYGGYGFGPGYRGRGYYGGRSGVGISIGGIGIRF